ncbi:MAG: CsgG/HfaB family protein [Treponema sp.]|jgi:curli biogenesis system outer membrane secretion channel CsgG|nr:CsgG/HfaB family protein [Treponema sp.]
MRRGYVFFAITVTGVLNFLSCATTASVLVTKPPVWNTSSINRIAVGPFTADQNSNLSRQIAQSLTESAIHLIQETGRFILIDYAELARLERSGENIADHVDAIFSGSITHVEIKDRTEYIETKRKGQVVQEPVYYRDAEIDFSYMLKRTGDGSIIGQRVKQGKKTSSKYKSQSEIPSEFEMLRNAVDEQIRYVGRDMAPWQVAERRIFEEDKMKDPRMTNAKSMIKQRSFRSAYTLYSTIYSENANFAAGYNAALCTEILGNIEEAAALMQQIWDDTGNPKAQTELARLQAVAEFTKVNEEYGGQTDTAINNAIKQASRELLEKIPAGNRISIVGGRGANQNTLDFIVEELSTVIINTGAITVVDRQQINTIIAEQRFQLSGEVSDETAVSIGRLSGSRIVISCSITGAGSLRRLRVRTISVETAEIIYQISLQI